MSTNFPTSLDNETVPAGSETLGGSTPPHRQVHENLKDAVQALEAKVGVDSSAVATSHDYKLAAAVTALSTHEADTTSIHGITNTALLETTAGAQSKADAAQAAAIAAVAADRGFVHRTSNSTALQSDQTVNDDPVLQLASVGVGIYKFESLLNFVSGATPDFRFTFIHTGTSSGMWSQAAANTLLTTYLTYQAFGVDFVASGSDGVPWSAMMKGVLTVTVTGTFKCQWAQGTSTASDTYLMAGSYIELLKVG